MRSIAFLSSAFSVPPTVLPEAPAIRLMTCFLVAGLFGPHGGVAQETQGIPLLRFFNTPRLQPDSSEANTVSARAGSKQGFFGVSSDRSIANGYTGGDGIEDGDALHLEWLRDPPRIRMFSGRGLRPKQPRIRVDFVIVKGLNEQNVQITPEKLATWHRQRRVEYHESGLYPPGIFTFSRNLTEWLRSQSDPDPWQSSMVFIFTMEPQTPDAEAPSLVFRRSHPQGVGSPYVKHHGKVSKRSFDYSNLGWCKSEYDATWTISIEGDSGERLEWDFRFKH